MAIPKIFIVYGTDLSVKSYMPRIFDEDKCDDILDEYSKISSRTNKEDTLSFAGAIINVFMDDSTYDDIDIIKRFTGIDLLQSPQICSLKEFDTNQMNSMEPSYIYYFNFGGDS